MSADWTSLPRPQLEQLGARARHWTSPTPRRVLHITLRWLERRGFELLGNGVHARVYHHPGDRHLVLKVFSTHNSGFEGRPGARAA